MSPKQARWTQIWLRMVTVWQRTAVQVTGAPQAYRSLRKARESFFRVERFGSILKCNLTPEGSFVLISTPHNCLMGTLIHVLSRGHTGCLKSHPRSITALFYSMTVGGITRYPA